MMNNDEPEVVISDDFIEAAAKESGVDVSSIEQLAALRTFMNVISDFCADICENDEAASRIRAAFIDPRTL